MLPLLGILYFMGSVSSSSAGSKTTTRSRKPSRHPSPKTSPQSSPEPSPSSSTKPSRKPSTEPTLKPSPEPSPALLSETLAEAPRQATALLTKKSTMDGPVGESGVMASRTHIVFDDSDDCEARPKKNAVGPKTPLLLGNACGFVSKNKDAKFLLIVQEDYKDMILLIAQYLEIDPATVSLSADLDRGEVFKITPSTWASIVKSPFSGLFSYSSTSFRVDLDSGARNRNYGLAWSQGIPTAADVAKLFKQTEEVEILVKSEALGVAPEVQRQFFHSSAPVFHVKWNLA
ncbi:hypothetical protein P7C73_g2521, partial [Tremellales sp. Uapishka_1]